MELEAWSESSSFVSPRRPLLLPVQILDMLTTTTSFSTFLLLAFCRRCTMSLSCFLSGSHGLSFSPGNSRGSLPGSVRAAAFSVLPARR